MEGSDLEESKTAKKKWLGWSNIKRTLFASLILFFLYPYYPFFVMQVKFLFDPSYPDRWTYISSSRTKFDHLFREANDKIEGSDKICFVFSKFKNDGLHGVFKGKVNYFFYPREVVVYNQKDNVNTEKLSSCEHSVILFSGDVTEDELANLDRADFLEKVHDDYGGYYTILIFKTKR